MFMKTVFKLTALFIFLFVADSAFAQYGYGYPGGMHQPGMDRSIGRVPNAPSKKDKDKKEVDVVEVTVNHLGKRLKLDDFQKAAITTVYNEYKTDVLLISGSDEPIAVKKAKMGEIVDIIDKKVMTYLSEQQIEEYKKMIEERKD